MNSNTGLISVKVAKRPLALEDFPIKEFQLHMRPQSPIVQLPGSLVIFNNLFRTIKILISTNGALSNNAVNKVIQMFL